MTLIELFKEYFANRSDLTRKCANSMRQRMEKYILPLLGARDIDGIRVSEIYRLLQEIREKNETARQLINYIGQCYTFAAALEYTARPNPAPALRRLMRLPAIKDHYPALGYQQLSELRVLFQDNDDGKQPNRSLTVNRQAVLMALYSLLRIGECAALKWAWLNEDTRTIEIPRERMKMRRDFRIPVTPQIDALLEYVKAFQESSGIDSEFVFSISGRRPLYAGAPTNLMRKYFKGRMVIHGIRSMGRTWMAEHGVDFAVAEASLAHVEHNAVVRAYSRTDYLEQRREVLEQWDEYVNEKLIKGQSDIGCLAENSGTRSVPGA